MKLNYENITAHTLELDNNHYNQYSLLLIYPREFQKQRLGCNMNPETKQ